MTTVLVTGANRGIGLEFAREYAADGARVYACCRDPDKATDLKSILGDLTVHKLDATSLGEHEALKHAIGGAPIDILIANAGVYGGKNQTAANMDYDEWLKTLDVNLLGPHRLAVTFHDNLKASQQKKFIAVTSTMGSIAETSGLYHAYRSSKAALNMIVRSLAKEWAADGIVAVPIHPGWVKTDMGGANAHLAPAQSVKEMRAVISGLTAADSGQFLNHDGRRRAW